MRWKRILSAVIFSVVGAAVLLYAGDYLVFKVRVATHRNPYGTVTVQHFDALLKKNGKAQFLFDPPAPQTCTNSLFPHDDFAPCWYLGRHREQGTSI